MPEGLLLLLRLLHYAVLLSLFGLTAFRWAGLRQLAAAPLALRIPRIGISAAVLAPLLSTALMLASIGAMMGQPSWMVDWATVEAIVTSTDMGWAFMARTALLCLGCLALVIQSRSHRSLLIPAIFYALALLTLAWSGHAAASEDTLGLVHRLNDGLHLLAAGLWLGAIGWFVHLTTMAHHHPDDVMPELLLEDMHRFAPLGAILVAVAAVTGVINAQLIFALKNSLSVLATGYGWLLAAKILLVGLMIVCGANNARISRRFARFKSQPPASANSALAALRVSLTLELFFATVVIGIVAVLGTASPTI